MVLVSGSQLISRVSSLQMYGYQMTDVEGETGAE